MSTALNASNSPAGLTIYNAAGSIGAILKDTETKWHGIIQSSNVIMTCFIAPELHHVEIEDPLPLQQGMAALMRNAHQLTSTGRIHIHATTKPSISSQQPPAITVIIADTGDGIAPASLNALFQNERPFGSLRSWAKENMGDLTVISNLGRGSEFTLTFNPSALRAKAPIETSAAEPEQARYVPIDLGLDDDPRTYEAAAAQVPSSLQRQNAAASLRGARILIVEDQISNQNMIEQLLASEDCDCISAHNGPRALSILEMQKIDFILMDIFIDGMTGAETTHAIRQSGKDYAHTPIIALTEDLQPEINAACMAAGANIFLKKPVTAKKLIEALKFLKRADVGSAYTMDAQKTIAA